MIETEEPYYPPTLSFEAVDVLRGLLNKNSQLRLGSRNGLEEIKNHPFFQVIDRKK